MLLFKRAIHCWRPRISGQLGRVVTFASSRRLQSSSSLFRSAWRALSASKSCDTSNEHRKSQALRQCVKRNTQSLMISTASLLLPVSAECNSATTTLSYNCRRGVHPASESPHRRSQNTSARLKAISSPRANRRRSDDRPNDWLYATQMRLHSSDSRVPEGDGGSAPNSESGNGYESDSSLPPIEDRPDWVLISEKDCRENYKLSDEDLGELRSVLKPDPYNDTQLTKWFYKRDAWESSRRKHYASKGHSKKFEASSLPSESGYSAVFGWRKPQSLERQRITFSLRPPGGLFGVEGGHIVRRALSANAMKLTLLVGFYWITNSVALFAEVLHSCADVANQTMLLFALHLASRNPDWMHPYGYSGGRWGFSCLSGAVMALMGASALKASLLGAVYHCEPVHLMFGVTLLLGTAALEAYSFTPAFRQIRAHANRQKTALGNYLSHGTDATTIHVFTEDATGFLCSLLALASLTASHFSATDVVLWDVLGGVAIGGTLTAVGTWLTWRNMRLIMGRSLSPAVIDGVLHILDKSPMVASYHDVKSMVVGVEACVVKVEVNYNADVIADKRIDTAAIFQHFQRIDQRSTHKQEAFHDLIMKSCADYQSWLTHERSQLEDQIRAEVQATGGFKQVHVDIENF